MEIKRLFIALIFLLFSNVSLAQDGESDEIYHVALQQYTITKDTLHAKYPNIYKAEAKEIYLQKPDFVDSIPPIINGYHILLITPANQKKLYKDHNGKLIHTIMFPLTNKGDKLFITITPYHGELKKNNYNLGLSDGTTIYFKFDCDKQKYTVDKVDNWGI